MGSRVSLRFLGEIGGREVVLAVGHSLLHAARLRQEADRERQVKVHGDQQRVHAQLRPICLLQQLVVQQRHSESVQQEQQELA